MVKQAKGRTCAQNRRESRKRMATEGSESNPAPSTSKKAKTSQGLAKESVQEAHKELVQEPVKASSEEDSSDSDVSSPAFSPVE